MIKRSSEAVRRGHPDKVADQISDAILDAHLAQDPSAKVACEVLVKGNEVFVTGEISSSATVDLEQVIRPLIQEIGYCDANWGMDWKSCSIKNNITKQSAELSSLFEGGEAAGDQAIVWGYATNETEEYLPLPFVLAQKIAVAELPFKFLRPDGKVLITTIGDKIDSLVLSLQHDESVQEPAIRAQLLDFLKDFYKDALTEETVYYINQSGSFTVGGPLADAGLTGRKLMVDTYGTLGLHGGGAFSGKDATKVDRSGAMAARYIAKNIVASGIVPECSVQIVYSIGLPDPITLNIDAACETEHLTRLVLEKFPLRVPEIIDAFNLNQPIYQALSFGGAFGHNHPWEKVDVAISSPV